jgi:large subunit ribosomal protein L30e
MTIDIEKELKVAFKTGKVTYGYKSSVKSIIHGKAKLVIVTENMPKAMKDYIIQLAKSLNVRLYNFSGSSLGLGGLCGKPFFISSIVVEDPGESGILQICGNNYAKH